MEEKDFEQMRKLASIAHHKLDRAYEARLRGDYEAERIAEASGRAYEICAAEIALDAIDRILDLADIAGLPRGRLLDLMIKRYKRELEGWA